MHYRLTGDSPHEEHALKAHPEARILFDPFIPALTARAMIAAARLGVFDALGTEARTVPELAKILSLDPDTLGHLMRLLAGAGYVSLEDGTCSLTELSRGSLPPGSPRPLSAWVRFNRIHWKIIDTLEEVLKTGKGGDIYQYLEERDDWEIMHQAMLETARPIAAAMAEMVPVSRSSDMLLDIGGSHGLYGAMICRLHPPMKSIALELPDAVEGARALAKREGISDVVTHMVGDAADIDPGREAYDVVFMGNLIHHFGIDENRSLLRRITDALTRGGTAAIWDFRLPVNDTEPDCIADGFALLFRLSSSSRLYGTDEIAAWMHDAGLSDVRIQPVPSPSHMLVTGRKA